MNPPYFCEQCMTGRSAQDRCQDCQAPLVDLRDPEAREETLQRLLAASQHRRKKFILAMQVLASFFCFGLLYVGLTVATGLESDLVSWGARIFAVLLLAASFYAIPRIYHRHLQGPEGRAFQELADQKASSSSAKSSS